MSLSSLLVPAAFCVALVLLQVYALDRLRGYVDRCTGSCPECGRSGPRPGEEDKPASPEWEDGLP